MTKEKSSLVIDDEEEDKRSEEKAKWGHQVRELFGSDALERLAAASSASHTSTPTSPELDLTDSELSVESDLPPETPKVARKSYANAVHSDDGVHDGLAPLPSKPLNATTLVGENRPRLRFPLDLQPLHNIVYTANRLASET